MTMSPPTPYPPCRICHGRLSLRWRKPVLQGQFTADYTECMDCQALQVPDPLWLDQAYAEEGTPEALTLDPGRLRRNLSAMLYLSALQQAEVIPGTRTIDIGGGSGLLTQLLLDAGWDAWQSDPHISQPDFAANRFCAEEEAMTMDPFDMISLLEVLEHLTDPMPFLSRLNGMLKPSGVLIASTEIYRSDLHGPEWSYLASEGGQHVTFWSMQALDRLRAHLGFASLGCFPGDTGFLLVFSHLPGQELQARIMQAWQVLQRSDHAANVLARIDLRYDSIVRGGIGLLGATITPEALQPEPSRPEQKKATIRSIIPRIMKKLMKPSR